MTVDGEEDSELGGETDAWRGVITSVVGLRVSSCVFERGRLFTKDKGQVPNDSSDGGLYEQIWTSLMSFSNVVLRQNLDVLLPWQARRMGSSSLARAMASDVLKRTVEIKIVSDLTRFLSR